MRYQFLCREILQLILLFITPIALLFSSVFRDQVCILKIVSLSYYDMSSIKMHLILSFHGTITYQFDITFLMVVRVWKQWLRM